MAKKKETKKAEVAPKVKAANEMVEVVIEKPQPKKPKWEQKTRTYILKGRQPLWYKMNTTGIYWYDEEQGYERELKYTSNQKTPFVDEFKGEARLAHVIFEDGILIVPKEKQTLQKLMSLYHPQKGILYEEYDATAEAVEEVEDLELEIDALIMAKSLDVDMAEAIMRVEIGSSVSNMSSKELKRDLLLFAKKNPALFLELANDENVHLRNIGVKATEIGIIKLSQDNRTFKWGSNDRKLMTVPFDEHPYSALAAWFKTDEGMEVFTSIEKQLK